MKLSLIKYIFNGFPETILLVYVTLGLLNIKIEIKDYLKVSILNILLVWIVRDVLGLFGLHSFILLATIILLIRFIVKVAVEKLIVSMLVSLIVLYVGEIISFSMFLKLFKINIDIINQDLIWYFLLIYISKIPLAIMALLIYKYNLRLFK